jgi:methyltransferase
VTVLHWTLGLVLVQRVVELLWAHRNTIRLRQLGGEEADAEGYPYFILLHAGWLVSLALFVPAPTPPIWPLLALFALLQLARLWVISSLGRYWTTRIITVPGAPLVQTGPFRWLRHPNYLLVVAEIALLPLAFGAVAAAVSFSAANLMLILRRIRIEESVLAPRRGLLEEASTDVHELQSSWPDVIRGPSAQGLVPWASTRPPSCGSAAKRLDHRVEPGDDESQSGKSVYPERPR